MKSMAFCIAIAVLAACARARAEGVPAPETPHVLFVNVGGALPASLFEKAASNACARAANLRYRTVEEKSLPDSELLGAREKRVAGRGLAVTVVYIVNDPGRPGILCAPGDFALVNLRNLRFDSPSGPVYEMRALKLVMKGLAFSAGVGAVQDDRCVMSWKSFSPAGIDGTSCSYGPFSSFPMQEIFRVLAGDGIYGGR